MLNLNLLNLPAHFFPHRTAEGFKEQGNAFYVKKDYAEAFNYYTKAIGTYLHHFVSVLWDDVDFYV